MRVLLAVAALVVVARTASVSLEDLEFHTWKLKFGKSYGSEEEESQRKMIWLDNLKLVLQHNLLADQGIKSYRLGMNRFADMSDREYQVMFKGCLGAFNRTKTRSIDPHLPQTEDINLPRAVDWRSKGYVTEVKDQTEDCRSCWAFSVTGALEGQMFRKTKKRVSLSEQQLVDCSREYGTKGCKGGWPHEAFKYIMYNKGLEAEKTYPYEAKEGRCRYNPKKAVATCYGYFLVENGGEDYLQSVVATIGPISVVIQTSQPSFKLYRSGVYDEPDCSSNIDHAVLIVGYGSDGYGKDYWLVKNSWGTDWGEQGYIKMSRNKNNQCGIASYIAYPLVWRLERETDPERPTEEDTV